MRIIRNRRSVSRNDRGAVAAIGNFDGVHLGHRSVVDLAKAEAEAAGAPSGVITFEPHPRQFFSPDAPPFRLMNAAARARRFESMGVDILYELAFDTDMANLSAEEFARDVLSDGLGIARAITGEDFKYGKGRLGNPQTLSKHGAESGFEVSVAPLASDDRGGYSSTSVRNALSEGRPEAAASVLGHWHRIEGRVLCGERRGRKLGFPTANISMADLHPPMLGVYAVLVHVLTGPKAGSYKGSASIGVRPTFGNNPLNLEVFIFDFSGDLYGEAISVALVAFLRQELKFDSVDALVRQMKSDCEESRMTLDTHA